MGIGRQQKTTWAVRGKIYSPGRPPVWQRDQVQRFWVGIAKGLSSEDAALSVGVSSPVGSRWFREAGGMRPVSLAPLSDRYLSFAERRHPQGEKLRCAGDRPTDKPFAVDDQPRAAPQCRHPGGVVGLSGHQCAMAR